ncbi:MAG: DUF4279 domain-containing protein [Roseivirga sp.]
MKGDYYVNKTECSFGFTSEIITPEEFTKQIAIKPSRSFKKGEEFIVKHSGSVLIRPWHLWEISSSAVINEQESIQPHIDYLKTTLADKVDILKKYKEDPSLELSIWIWIESENAGMGFDISAEDMHFMSKICNRISFSLLATENIE